MAIFGISFVINEDGKFKSGYDTVDGWDLIDARQKFVAKNPQAQILAIDKVAE